MTDRTEDGSRPRAGRARLAVIAGVASLAGLTACGLVYWTIYQGELARVASPPADPAPVAARAQKAAPDRPIGEDEPAFWSDVAVYKAGPARPIPIVVVRRGKQPTAGDDSIYSGLLAREVVRQGLLLSAREDFGALTRDVPIGDPEVAGPPDATFRIGSRFRLFYQSNEADPADGRITIAEGEGAARRVLWSREFPCGVIISPDFAELVALVEGFARGGFREVLESRGLTRGNLPAAARDPGELPEGFEARLGKLAEEQQFAAIRALHSAIRSKGPTPSTLSALARGYANLGSLADAQWTSDATTFQARALLYAQRAAVLGRDSPATLRARAYAQALAGMFREANADLDRADQADGGKAVPNWVTLARAYARSNVSGMGEIARTRPDDVWPLYFRTRMLSRASGHIGGHGWKCRGEVVGAARAVLEKVPDCFAMHEAMAALSGVSNLHVATSLGLDLYPTATPARVAAVPGLPAGVADAPGEVELRGRLVAAAADDPSDLTWGVLARQLREIRFLMICRRIHFLSGELGTDASGFAAESLPLIADHPNRGQVEVWAGALGGRDPRAVLRSLDYADIQPKANDLLRLHSAVAPDLSKELYHLLWSHDELGTVLGQEDRLKDTREEKSQANSAHNLLKYDPDSPLGRGWMIRSGWDEAAPNAEGWAKDHGGSDTFVIAQLGLHKLKENKLDEAEGLLSKALARSPDHWIFDGLAEVYRRGDKMDRWVGAVSDYLKTEDMALDHARVVGDLAKYLIGKGRYDRARPFAEISAESGAAWAMLQAARCAERTGDPEAAERWVAQTSARYASSWLEWFFWCKRTNSGDLAAAAGLARARIAGGMRPGNDVQERELAFFHLLDNRPDAARQVLERRLARKRDVLDGILLALACDRLGDAPARDAAIKAIADEPAPNAPKTAATVAILADWIAKGKPEPFDPAPVEAIIATIEPDNRPNSWLAVGLILDRVGRPEDAIPFLKKADVPRCYNWYRLLARDALRARGVEPSDFPY